MGAFAQHDTCAVLAPVAGDHLRARLAARMDRDHHHLRAYLPADVEALQHRPDPVGYTRVRELAGGVPVTAGRDVGVLSQGRGTEACHAQPDLRRHDALHGDRYPVHGDHVSLAADEARGTATVQKAISAPTSVMGVRRAKAALSSGCKPHPATAPAGSNRSSHGGNEVAEAFDWRVTNW